MKGGQGGKGSRSRAKDDGRCKITFRLDSPRECVPTASQSGASFRGLLTPPSMYSLSATFTTALSRPSLS